MNSVEAASGIMPGCGCAVALLHTLLGPLLRAAAAEHHVDARKYVDDMVLWARHADPARLVPLGSPCVGSSTCAMGSRGLAW